MKFPTNRSRRNFLKVAGSGLLAGAFYPRLLAAETERFARRPDPAFKADVEIALKAKPSSINLLPGPPTKVWRYQGELLKGGPGSVQSIPKSYLGPVFRLTNGQKVRIFFKNELPEMCVTHWHGLHVPAAMDGHPMDAVNTGETLVYEFEILNRAGTYWFHPHTHELTATQVYAGLAGLFIVTDSEEQALDLPNGAYDVPLVLQDRTFTSENQFRYVTHPMETMMGFHGDRILINGKPDFALDVSARAYRLRLLNGSNSRIYKLAWDDRTPLIVIGSDGGLLEHPVTRDFVMLAPAERIELWADFGDREIGSEMTLKSLPFSGTGHGMHHGMRGGNRPPGMGRGMMGGMGHGMMGGMMHTSLPEGSAYPLMKVRIARKADDNSVLPERLSRIEKLKVDNAANRNQPRQIMLSMTHRSPRINGRPYEMDHILAEERIPLNTLQLIELQHAPSHGMGGMMAMPHPIHLHGQPFQVLERSIDPAHRSDYQTVSPGYVDSGWKDTVLVMPGESVRILKPFDRFPGRFMIHCHNLEHEDAGMMRDFWVE